MLLSAMMLLLVVGCVQGLNVTDDYSPQSVYEFRSDYDGESYTIRVILKYSFFADEEVVAGFMSHTINAEGTEVSRVDVTFLAPTDAVIFSRFMDRVKQLPWTRITWITKSPFVEEFWLGVWPHVSYLSVHVYGVSLKPITVSNLRGDDLRELVLTGNSWATTSGLTFSLQYLKKLSLFENQIEEVHGDLLTFCRSLEVLDLSRNNITSLMDIRTDTAAIRELNLAKNNISYFETSLILKSFMYLNKLNMSYNQISSVNLGSIPKNIEIDLSFNNIVSCQHPGYHLMVDRVVLAGQNIYSLSEVGTILSNIDCKMFESSVSNEEPVYYNLNSHHPVYVPFSECNVNKKHTSCKQKGSHILLRRDVHLVNLSGNPIKIDESLVLEMRAEKHVDLSQNHFNILDEDVPGQISKIEQLNLSRNSITYISKHFFKNMTRLTVIDLSHNHLKQVQLILYSSLFMLDISKNYLSRVSISHSSSNYTTKYLNLSHNSFRNILIAEWSQFEQFSEVDLGQNSLQCCGYEWYYSRAMFLQYQHKILNVNSNKSLSCVTPHNNRDVEMTDIWLSEDHCQHSLQGWIAFGCLLMVTPLVITAIDLFDYYTHQVERDLAHHLTHVKKQGLAQDEKHALDCEYDAFVCHSHQDARWVTRELVPNLENNRDGHRLCIHFRDFPLGSLIEENIETAMDKSRKVIVVVSRAFLKSYWCKMELTFAWTKMVSEGKNFIIVIELDKIPKGKRPPILTFLMESRTYLEWPEEPSDVVKQESWSRVRDALGKSLRNRQETQCKPARRRNCTQTATDAFVIDC